MPVIACNPYRLRYWNRICSQAKTPFASIACNPYRLRYWNKRRYPPQTQKQWIACNPYRLRYWNTPNMVDTTAAVSIACNPYRLRYWNGKTPQPWSPRRIACNPYRLRYWNLTRVLVRNSLSSLHAIHTACGIETVSWRLSIFELNNCMQSIPLAVLKRVRRPESNAFFLIACNPYRLRYWNFSWRIV